ncbi:MAG: fatty acid desaturase [Ilumatobacter sp.]|nr:fatty acid desaturase [Ilumatobacter sp.]
MALAVAVHGSWLAIVLSHPLVPWWATTFALAIVLAWHGSLQHEVIHGHPFPNRLANDALGSIPLSPRLPYLAYRRDHLRHHASPSLTDPLDDVESYYFTPDEWRRLSHAGRWVAVAHTTLLGRMLLGPPREIMTVWGSHFREIRRGDRALGRWWTAHLLGCVVLGSFVVGVVGMPIGTYLGAIYVGHGLSLVRSFCEHRWVPGTASRSAVVRSGRFFSLLFLNNNLHHTHHARPGAPWYRLPGLAASLESDRAAADGAGWYDGYLDVVRRHLLRPTDVLVHPTYPDHRRESGLDGGFEDGRAGPVVQPAPQPAPQPAS